MRSKNPVFSIQYSVFKSFRNLIFYLNNEFQLKKCFSFQNVIFYSEFCIHPELGMDTFEVSVKSQYFLF